MYRRILDYSNKHFRLFDQTKDICDQRAKPQISPSDVSKSILSMAFSNMGSLHKLEQSRKISNISRVLERVPSTSTIARSADGLDLDQIRAILRSIYKKAKRSKMIEPYYGRWIGVIDGHEICSSPIYRCSLCSVRNVANSKDKIKLNYYHRYSAFILAGPKFSFMLDMEPIYPGEGELTSSARLLERVCTHYPRAFDVVCGDGLYLNASTFKLLETHKKYAVAVLKDEKRQLYEEAMRLSETRKPIVYEKDKTTYRVWDHLIEGLWDSYQKPIRVIRSEETKTVRFHSEIIGQWKTKQEKADWLWTTNLPSVVSLKKVVSISHSRWQIENQCFNEAANIWHGDHVYRHSQNAISAFILFLFIVLNIFNIFFNRNIKDKRIRTKSFLIELIRADFLTRWLKPIPL